MTMLGSDVQNANVVIPISSSPLQRGTFVDCSSFVVCPILNRPGIRIDYDGSHIQNILTVPPITNEVLGPFLEGDGQGGVGQLHYQYIIDCLG